MVFFKMHPSSAFYCADCDAMANEFGGYSASPNPVPHIVEDHWRRFVALLVRWRIRISLIVFLALIAGDVFAGIRPHDLLNYHDSNSIVGLALVLVGLAIRSWAAGILHKRVSLTSAGPYALVRHPLYVGSFLMMVGFCTLIGDAVNFYFVLGPFVVLYFLQIRTEERTLADRFGEHWQHYAKAVPQFLPRRLPKSGVGHWNLGQWTRNREYQAVVATLLGLLALEVWRMA